MANFGLLTAEIGSCVWGILSKFQRVSRLAFVTAATSLTGGQPNFARCLAVSWAVTLYILLFIYTLSGASGGIFSGAKFSLRPSLAFSYIGTALQQRASAKLCVVVKGRKLRNFLT